MKIWPMAPQAEKARRAGNTDGLREMNNRAEGSSDEADAVVVVMAEKERDEGKRGERSR